MLRLLPAVTLLLLPAAALAQEVPEAAHMDLWCGTAFVQMTADAPADAEGKKIGSAAPYAEGGRLLVERALPIYLESGYSDAALASLRARLEAEVDRDINGAGWGEASPPYSFQQCSALIGQ